MKIALVGRSEARLREVQLKNSDWDIITGVDLKDCHAVESVVKKSRVVLSTAGPYAILGDALVQSCVKCKTDYIDITGEIHWVEQVQSFSKSCIFYNSFLKINYS